MILYLCVSVDYGLVSWEFAPSLRFAGTGVLNAQFALFLYLILVERLIYDSRNRWELVQYTVRFWVSESFAQAARWFRELCAKLR